MDVENIQPSRMRVFGRFQKELNYEINYNEFNERSAIQFVLELVYSLIVAQKICRFFHGNLTINNVGNSNNQQITTNIYSYNNRTFSIRSKNHPLIKGFGFSSLELPTLIISSYAKLMTRTSKYNCDNQGHFLSVL